MWTIVHEFASINNDDNITFGKYYLSALKFKPYRGRKKLILNVRYNFFVNQKSWTVERKKPNVNIVDIYLSQFWMKLSIN